MKTLTENESRIVLNWFEAAHTVLTPFRLNDKDYALAGELYRSRNVLPPLRLRHLIPSAPAKILGAREMMHWLLENKYVVNDTGRWESPDVRPDFMPEMWAYCGGTDEGQFTWLPEWFEREK